MDEDYWYDHRDELRPDQIFRCRDGSIVKLDRHVAGDGTQWRVIDGDADGWGYWDNVIEPGDLQERLSDDYDPTRAA